METASYNAQGKCNSCGHVRGTVKTTRCGWCDDVVRITVLDPGSSDPTWGVTSDSVVVCLSASELAAVEDGSRCVKDFL